MKYIEEQKLIKSSRDFKPVRGKERSLESLLDFVEQEIEEGEMFLEDEDYLD